jgi:uncharacterized membrane protein YfcA
MAHSRQRHKHAASHMTHTPHAGPKKKKSAVGFMTILLASFGAAIILVTRGTEIAWLAGGIAVGAAAGYYLGKQIDKSAKE